MNGVAMQDYDYYVIFNERAGTASAQGVTADALRAMFEDVGLRCHVDARGEVPLTERVADAVAGPADIIVAAGGDGTITALAEALTDSAKSLAILPLGTVNALAKDLNIPLEIRQSVEALARGQRQLIDVGEVNGRTFLHKVVVGVIPAVAAGREYIRDRHGIAAKIGFLRYFVRRLQRTKRMAVLIRTPGGETRIERVQAIAVASNAYDEGLGQFFSRSTLDRGTLTLYILRHLTLGDVIRLSISMLMGHWQNDDALSIESVESVTITTHKDLLKVMFDGEVETLRTPLEFCIRPKALSVIVQPSVAAEELVQ
jgi:diacylglycerol kinase family enzyme